MKKQTHRPSPVLPSAPARSLVRRALLNAWKRWRQNELPPLQPPLGPAAPPAATTDQNRSERRTHAGEAGPTVRVGEAGGKKGDGGNGGAPVEVDAGVEEDEAKEDMWRRRQALLCE